MTPSTHVFYHISFRTAFGFMRPVSDGSHLIRLDWDQRPFESADREDDVSRETMRQLQAYLSGELHQFNLPMRPEGKSQAALAWLNVMATIPYGTTMTYAEYAAAAGKPKASRAAGTPARAIPYRSFTPATGWYAPMGHLEIMGEEAIFIPPTQIIWIGKKQSLIDLERTQR